MAFPEFELIPEFDDAGAQLPHFFTGCGNCGLDVVAFFELRPFELFAKAEDGFLELFYLKVGTHFTPASSWSMCQFSSRSCFVLISVAEGLPSLSKCFENRPSERANVMKSTGSPVLGFTYQSSFTLGLPARLS